MQVSNYLQVLIMNKLVYVSSCYLWLEIPVRDVIVVQHFHPIDDLVEELAGLVLGHMLLGHNEVEHITTVKINLYLYISTEHDGIY